MRSHIHRHPIAIARKEHRSSVELHCLPGRQCHRESREPTPESETEHHVRQRTHSGGEGFLDEPYRLHSRGTLPGSDSLVVVHIADAAEKSAFFR